MIKRICPNCKLIVRIYKGAADYKCICGYEIQIPQKPPKRKKPNYKRTR